MYYLSRLVLLLVLIFTACSSETVDTNQEKEGVFDAQIESLEKAKALEQEIMESAEQQQRALEEQIGD